MKECHKSFEKILFATLYVDHIRRYDYLGHGTQSKTSTYSHVLNWL